MTATRPSGAPYGPEGTGTESEVGTEGAKPPQGDTALRERLVRALARTVYRDDDPPPHVLRICEPWADEIAAEVEAWAAEQTQRAEQAEALLRELVDPDECYYDHHGNCQAHYLDKKPCPVARAKELLTDRPEGT